MKDRLSKGLRERESMDLNLLHNEEGPNELRVEKCE